LGLWAPSGAGKTTVIDLVLGLLTPTAGKITVDGQDIQANLPDWQQKIGYIPQSIFLSDDTIRRNIAFGLPDQQIDDQQLWNVIRMAQLEKFVHELPDGIETVVGENGVRMSGGQRQRVAIARALYHNPQVLIMDEATAALDNETEQQITWAIEQLAGDKTLLIIAHRLTTVRNCDRLYFMKDGQVVATGPYEQLVAEDVRFKAIASASLL
jgi:ABC-type multidrug transport system fused ATPase/permease subunit